MTGRQSEDALLASSLGHAFLSGSLVTVHDEGENKKMASRIFPLLGCKDRGGLVVKTRKASSVWWLRGLEWLGLDVLACELASVDRRWHMEF